MVLNTVEEGAPPEEKKSQLTVVCNNNYVLNKMKINQTVSSIQILIIIPRPFMG